MREREQERRRQEEACGKGSPALLEVRVNDSSWPQNSREEYSKNFVTYVFLSSVHFP